MKKKMVKATIDYNQTDDLPNMEIDVASLLSEMLGKEIDKEIMNSLFEQNKEDNIKILENVFPDESIHSASEKLGIKDLRKEWNLVQKIRNWKINNIIN